MKKYYIACALLIVVYWLSMIITVLPKGTNRITLPQSECNEVVTIIKEKEVS